MDYLKSTLPNGQRIGVKYSSKNINYVCNKINSDFRPRCPLMWPREKHINLDHVFEHFERAIYQFVACKNRCVWIV